MTPQYELSGGILATSAKDLSDGDAKTRSRAGSGPSIAWTIGHLCHYKITMLQLLGRTKANPFAASFEHAAATDGSNYPALAELLASCATLNGELSAAVSEGSWPQGHLRTRPGTVVTLATQEAEPMSPTAVKTKSAFRRSVRVDVDISATPEKIWSLLTNVADASRPISTRTFTVKVDTFDRRSSRSTPRT